MLNALSSLRQLASPSHRYIAARTSPMTYTLKVADCSSVPVLRTTKKAQKAEKLAALGFENLQVRAAKHRTRCYWGEEKAAEDGEYDDGEEQ